MNKPKGLYLSSFKAITADIKDEIIKYTAPFAYIDGLILMITSNITTIEVEHHDRYEGAGNYNFRRLIRLWIQMATNFSIVPLRMASFLGFLFAIFGFIYATWLIIGKFTFGITPTGWSSLIVSILVLGGVQLLTIGIIGEYVGRMYLNLNRKPQYVVKTKKNFEKS